MDGEHHDGRQRFGARPVVGLDEPVDADHVEERVDRHPLALGVHALVGHRAVLHVRVVRPVAGQAPHLGVAHGDLRRRPGVVGLDHRRGDLLHEELGERGVEPGAVGRVVVVEVGPHELAGTGMGVGGADPDPGERDVGAVSDGFCHQVLDHRRAGEKVALDDRNGRPARPEVRDPGPEPRAEAVAVVGVGRVPGLRHARRRREVDLGSPGEHTIDVRQLRHGSDLHTEPDAGGRAIDERLQCGGDPGPHDRRPYWWANGAVPGQPGVRSGPGARSRGWPRRPSRA